MDRRVLWPAESVASSGHSKSPSSLRGGSGSLERLCLVEIYGPNLGRTP